MSTAPKPIILVTFLTGFMSGALPRALPAWELTATIEGPSRTYHGAAALNGQLLIFGGEQLNLTPHADIWSSHDGIEWTPVSAGEYWSPRSRFGYATYAGKLWVVGGMARRDALHDVWSTADAVHWSLVLAQTPWMDRSGPLLVFQDRLWMIGSGSGVWSTLDGIAWTSVTLSAPWAIYEGASSGYQPRRDFAVCVHRNRMYVAGGVTFHGSIEDVAVYHADVWSSADGAHWDLEIENAPWSGRFGLALISAADRIWMMGGVTLSQWPASDALNDVWCSSDGRDWALIDPGAPWFPRYGHRLALFQNRLWLSGGSAGDVWSLAVDELAAQPRWSDYQ